MPLTSKGTKILHSMEKEYGEKKGKSVFYASKNKGTIKGVEDKFKTNEFAKKYRATLAERDAKRQALKKASKVGGGKSHITGNVYEH